MTELLHEVTVSAESSRVRLDVFLAEVVGSRAAAQRLIDADLVKVDGVNRQKRYLVSEGQLVLVEKPDPKEQRPAAPEAEFAVVFEDEDLIVVDKPAGVVVHPGHARSSGTLVQALGTRARGGNDPDRPGIVHRLDRGTSGLMVVAASEPAYKGLVEALRERIIKREYAALVEGQPSARTGTIDAPLGRDRRDPTVMSTDTERGRMAITHFSVERALPTSSLLAVELQTGRTHQIRAHFKEIGHPVAGDPEYGTAGLFGLKRQFLHSRRLAFQHPVTGDQIDLTSPLPADFTTALELAEKAEPKR